MIITKSTDLAVLVSRFLQRKCTTSNEQHTVTDRQLVSAWSGYWQEVTGESCIIAPLEQFRAELERRGYTCSRVRGRLVWQGLTLNHGWLSTPLADIQTVQDAPARVVKNQLVVRCPFCEHLHYHGTEGGTVQNGTTRVSHCRYGFSGEYRAILADLPA